MEFACGHPLQYVKSGIHGVDDRSGMVYCNRCNGADYSETYNGLYCSECRSVRHQQCMKLPEIINHPCHSRHPLKKVSLETTDYTDGRCHFCQEELIDQFYHCSLCNFSIDVRCCLIQPELTVHQPKSHDHTFTLLPTKVSFTCNACALAGDRNPYICLECGFMLHRECIDLPRVININRHGDRISRTYHLGRGNWRCGVCRKKIDWTLGAFSCKRCPDYVVHSKCATRSDVWDGEELEDAPEEEEEEDPYKVINDKEILHFSHEHNLKLGEDNVTDYEKVRCDICILPINYDPFFKCVQCKFFLHKVCASLPRKKRNILHEHKFTLEVVKETGLYLKCPYCLQFFDGFKYICTSHHLIDYTEKRRGKNHVLIDVRCGSISEPFHHELHPHPLYRTSSEKKVCGACGMECATLPRKVKHICDAHVLTLHHGAGNSKGELWCDICEGKTDPNVWYYGCADCEVTLHIKCVIGDTHYLKPGNSYRCGELVPNNGMTRPFCIVCENRCIFPSFLKGIDYASRTVVYACSMKCAKEFIWELLVSEFDTFLWKEKLH